MRILAELIRWRAQRHPDLDAIWKGLIDWCRDKIAGYKAAHLGRLHRQAAAQCKRQTVEANAAGAVLAGV